MKLRHLISMAAAMLMITPALASDITGAGSTFVYPLLSKWADAYKTETGTGLNYQSIGSGGGIKQIEAKTVTFGATDKPVKDDELAANGLAQFPIAMGGIVPVVNIPGIPQGDLVLNGPLLADIFSGKITAWNDAAIVALNPGLALPNIPVVVVHRSDGSGTTFNFTNYLSKVSESWANDFGSDSAIEWPVGIGGKGSEGVANIVKQTPGGISYVEFAYATQNGLQFSKLVNAAGKTVSPSLDSFQAAAANADFANAKNFNLILTDQPGDASWPITATTWVLIHTQSDADIQAALKFFDWAYTNGKGAATELFYVSLPDSVVDLVKKSWVSIQ